MVHAFLFTLVLVVVVVETTVLLEWTQQYDLVAIQQADAGANLQSPYRGRN
jgi:preprotein translocase subunit SecG